ncbi:MAG TPA: IS110 family transposase [Pyrinomonadaceae bacterium]|jgi:transposase|nr:IS110 family transposase [Pyrinomonadaceae bacterium]
MNIIHRCCCGLDVHAKTVVACLIKHGKKQIRTYSTMTDDLLRLSDWLVSEGCRQVAIESTGVYWKPVFNILEGVLEVVLVNARHVKGVPGRKTDVRDCEWLADLLRHGLLRASFIPPLPIRELRELTRHRHTLVRDQTAVSNRIIKLVESANIKLAEVASNALGVSGRAMLRALAKGEEDAAKMAGLARGRLKVKQGQLTRALQGRLTRSQRFVLTELLDQLDQLEAAVTRVSAEICEQIEESSDPFVKEAVELLQTIPGVGEQIAEVIVSEIGTDMTRFPSDKHLASWAGVCPGNNESAGKRKSGKTTKGSNYLRAGLTQASWAASHTKLTYLAAQHKRLIRRMGKKKALVAVGHSILVIAYHILKNRASYHELGGDYFDRQNVELLRARYIRKLETLGLKVSIEVFSEAA